MGEQTYRQVTVPEAGEDLLESLRAMSESTISVTTCDSVAEADLIADAAIADGKTVNRRNPMVFWINGVNLYIHNGTRIRPANMTEYWNTTYTGKGEWFSLAAGNWLQIGPTSGCPARPYDRVVTAQANVNVNIGKGDDNVAGWAYLAIEINGQKSPYTALDEGLVQGAGCYNLLHVPAGESPNVRMMIGARGKTIQYMMDPSLSSLHVTASPSAMDMD